MDALITEAKNGDKEAFVRLIRMNKQSYLYPKRCHYSNYSIMYLIPVLTSITKCHIMYFLLEFLCKISLLNSPLPVHTNCRWFIHSESVVQSHIVLHWDNADTRSTAHDQTDETLIQFFFRCCMITQIISRQFSLSYCDALPPSHNSFIIMGSCICHAVLRIIMCR